MVQFKAKVKDYAGIRIYNDIGDFYKTLKTFINESGMDDIINITIFDIKNFGKVKSKMTFRKGKNIIHRILNNNWQSYPEILKLAGIAPRTLRRYLSYLRTETPEWMLYKKYKGRWWYKYIS